MVEWKSIKKDELSQNFVQIDNDRLLKTTVIYWPNASWKSTILRAVLFLKNLVLLSHKFNPKEPFDSIGYPQWMRLSPFLLDKETQAKPTELSISFISHKNIHYKYYIKLNVKKIIEEKLIWYYTFKPTILIDRKDENISFNVKYFGRAKSLISEIRENQLALSVCADKNIEEALNIYDYFRRIYIFMDWIQNEFDTQEMLNNDNSWEFKKFLINLVRKADFSIKDFYRETNDVLFKDLTEQQKQNTLISLSHVGIEFNENTKFKVSKKSFSHNLYTSGQDIWEFNIPYDYESMWTKWIFNVAGTIYNVMKQNYVLFWDEFDKSLHPDLTRNIIETIHNSNIWWQFILNTHDTSLLDTKSLFRRDQIRFVEKNEIWASNLYSLLEFKERSNQDIEKQYLKWRYWAIPSFSDDPLF